jgi:hypothetical protein
MVGLTATAVPDKVGANAEVRDDYAATARFVADLDLDDAILFLPRRGDSGFLSSTPFLENDLDLDQPVLYAEDRAEENFALLDRYPDRAVHRLTEDLRPGETTGGALAASALRVERGPAPTVAVELADATGGAVVTAYATDSRTEWRRTLDRSSGRGEAYATSWTVVPRARRRAPAAPSSSVPRERPGSGFEVREPGRPGAALQSRHPVPGAGRPGRAPATGVGVVTGDGRRARWVEDAVGNPSGERPWRAGPGTGRTGEAIFSW